MTTYKIKAQMIIFYAVSFEKVYWLTLAAMKKHELQGISLWLENYLTSSPLCLLFVAHKY
ncbi:hypothetical protein PPE03_28040 [Pseudoalteromonas peptidolytica]|nr:hypothetical protein PPE03_28040 [Pseudoalteromonas peptidolytica]